jgi:hypothetical protein
VLLGKFGMSPYASSTFGDGSIVSASPPRPEPHTIATLGKWREEGRRVRMWVAVWVARVKAFGGVGASILTLLRTLSVQV